MCKTNDYRFSETKTKEKNSILGSEFLLYFDLSIFMNFGYQSGRRASILLTFHIRFRTHILLNFVVYISFRVLNYNKRQCHLYRVESIQNSIKQEKAAFSLSTNK